MAITWVDGNNGGSSPNAATTVAINATAAGDLIVVAFGVGDSAGANNDLALTGYTEIADLSLTTDTQDVELFVGYKISAGGETSVGPFTALGGTNAANAAVVSVFRGVASAAQGGPLGVATPTTATGIDTASADPPQIATAAGEIVVIAAASGHTGAGSATYTFPTGYTSNFTFVSWDDTNDVLVGLAHKLAPANPENPGVITAATVGTDLNNSWNAATFVLKTAPAATSDAMLRRYRRDDAWIQNRPAPGDWGATQGGYA